MFRYFCLGRSTEANADGNTDARAILRQLGNTAIVKILSEAKSQDHNYAQGTLRRLIGHITVADVSDDMAQILGEFNRDNS